MKNIPFSPPDMTEAEIAEVTEARLHKGKDGRNQEPLTLTSVFIKRVFYIK